MFTNIEAVIFDMDGTLIDSMWIWKDIDINYLKKHGHELPEDLQKEIEGFSFTETAHYFKNRFNIEDDVETIMSEWNEMAYDYYLSHVPLKEDVMTVLERLKNAGIKLGIATSNSKELVGIIKERFGFHNYFQTIRTSCEVNRGKPHPDVYERVAMDLGVEPQRCLVFEDVAMGIQGGKSAGMRVCGIYDDFSKDYVEHLKALADYYIYGYSEILALMDGDSIKKEA